MLGGSLTRNQVQRDELPGNVIGLRKSRGYRATKADAGGGTRKGGEKGQRLELVHVHREPTPSVKIFRACRRCVGDEEHVELAAFGQLCISAEVIDVGRGGGAGVRMDPRRRVGASRLVR